MKAKDESGPTKSSRGRRILPRILLSLAAVLITIGAVESGARIFWNEPRDMILSADFQTLWRLPPGKTLEWGGTRYHINSQGYRGPEFSIEKPSGVLRIYLSGDSSVFGDGVQYDETFGAGLVAILQPHVPNNITLQVINGGVPGFSTVQSIARLDEDGWHTGPAILVVANLWSDAARSDFPDKSQMWKSIDDPCVRAAVRWDRVLNHLTAYRFSKCVLRSPRQIGRVDSQDIPLGLPRRVSPEDYDSNLRHMIQEARKRKVYPILMVLPHTTDQDLRDDADLQSMRADISALDQTELEQDYRGAMRRVARETSTLLIDVPEMVASSQGELFVDALHPNQAGHALIARALAKSIQDAGVLAQVSAADQPAGLGVASKPNKSIESDE